MGFETEILKAHKPIITYEVKTIYSEDAITKARMLAREEGLLVGISAGANIAVCLEVNAPDQLCSFLLVFYYVGMVSNM